MGATQGPWAANDQEASQPAAGEQRQLFPASVTDQEGHVMLFWAFRSGDGRPNRDVRHIALFDPEVAVLLIDVADEYRRFRDQNFAGQWPCTPAPSALERALAAKLKLLEGEKG
jgi:hypothetical protein